MAVNIQETLDLLARLQEQSQEAVVKRGLAKVLADLRTFLQDQENERNKLLEALNQSKAEMAKQQETIASLQAKIAEQAQLIANLRKQLAAGGTTTTSSAATPLGLATSFKGVIDAIQAEARNTPGMATTIKSMDIEVKGLVQVLQDKSTVMVLPAEGSVVDANTLSTLRVSFGAIPVVLAARQEPDPATPVKPTVAPAVGSGATSGTRARKK